MYLIIEEAPKAVKTNLAERGNENEHKHDTKKKAQGANQRRRRPRSHRHLTDDARKGTGMVEYGLAHLAWRLVETKALFVGRIQ